jgi:ligand-binding sensor domain-containing protein
MRTWTTRDGLLTDSIRALHRDADGTLWIGTLGGGLARHQ